MKKLLLVILSITVLLIGGCDNTFGSDITMEIKEETLTTKGATVVIKDTTEGERTYGEWFRIDHKEGKKWVSLKTITDSNYGFNLMGYSLDENHEVYFEIDWEWIYGSLQPGTYRIVKKTPENSEIYANFIIE